MNLFQKIQKRPMEICLWIIFAIQFILIAYSNLTMLDNQLDIDTGKLYNHIMCMRDEGTIRIPGWAHTTTMEWDCVTLFALPLYILCQDIYLACGLANIIILTIFTLIVFWMFDDKNQCYPLLTMNLIAVPYSIGMLDYYNMTFFGGGQYGIKIMFSLLAVGLFLHLERFDALSKKQKRIFYAFSSMYIFLLLLTSASSGNYVAACTLVPIYGVYILYKFFKWERMSLRSVLLIAVSAVCVVAGMYINSRVMGGARGMNMVFCSVWQTTANTFSCLTGIFELMGGATQNMELAVLSPDGIKVLIKLCFTVLYIVCGFVAVARCIKKKGNLRLLLLVACPIWNYFILNVIRAAAGSPTYEYRYHLVGMIPLICVSVIVLLDGFFKSNKGQQICMFAVGVMAVCILHLISFRALYTRGELNQDLKDLCAYCKELDADVIYLYDGSDDSNMCRVLDRSVPYLCVMDNGLTYVFNHYAKYDGMPMQTENAVIVVEHEKSGDRGDVCELWGGVKLVRFEIIGSRSLYYIE